MPQAIIIILALWIGVPIVVSIVGGLAMLLWSLIGFSIAWDKWAIVGVIFVIIIIIKWLIFDGWGVLGHGDDNNSDSESGD